MQETQQAEPSAHRQHNTFLAHPPLQGSLPQTGRADAKTSHANSELLLRQTGATSNSWGGFFPTRKA